jgi:hypothetical protein
VVLKAFFDGGNEADSTQYDVVTLASVSGTIDLWKAFERDWRAILTKHGAAWLHTTDLVAGNSPYANRDGWSEPKRTAFISACISVIDKHIVIQKPTMRRRGLVPYAVTIYLKDYLRARADNREVPRTLTELLSTQVVYRCLDLGYRMETDFFHLFFDQGEPYMGHIMDRKRKAAARKQIPMLEKIIQIGEIDMRKTPGLQMADVFAWCASHRDIRPRPRWQNVILNHHKVFDERFRYEQIVTIQPGITDLVNSWGLPRRKPTR